ncbi:MAG: hypothetical protein KGI36_13760, partial [Burkholderiales bacterium]|nr:hypothetical protein [Burkholderiales bacterium]
CAAGPLVGAPCNFVGAPAYGGWRGQRDRAPSGRAARPVRACGKRPRVSAPWLAGAIDAALVARAQRGETIAFEVLVVK